MTTPSGPDPGAGAAQRRRSPAELALPALAIAVAVLLYLPTLRGDFVYSDTTLLVRNPLIQDARYLPKLFTADLWAVNSPDGKPWSNYWRPALSLWWSLHYHLFGLTETTGWHASNILLNALVLGLAWRVLRQLRVAPWTAGAITLLLAVHPTRVSSVVWLTGSVDLLLAALFLGAFSVELDRQERPGGGRLAAALALFAVALLTKEPAVFLPALVFVARLARPDEGGEKAGERLAARLAAAVRAAAPYALLVGVYLALRVAVLGAIARPIASGATAAEALRTAPAVAAFYLRQALVPLWLGPSHPLRALGPSDVGLASFWLPLAAVLLFAVVAAWAASRGRAEAIGATLFALPMLPALNIRSFLPERVVQEHQLYLPLAGLFLLLLPALQGLLERPSGSRRSAGSAARACFLAAAVVGVPLAAQTLRYSRAWTSELALWEWATRSDPGGTTSWGNYATELLKAGRTEEALAAAERSLRNGRSPQALLVEAEVATRRGDLPVAERTLRAVLASPSDNLVAERAIARLGVVLQRGGRLPEAEGLLRQARDAIPGRRCAFTKDLAIVLHELRRPDEALRELTEAAGLVDEEPSVGCRQVLFYLGQLHEERGAPADALRAYEGFLRVASSDDTETRRLRGIAESRLAALGR